MTMFWYNSDHNLYVKRKSIESYIVSLTLLRNNRKCLDGVGCHILLIGCGVYPGGGGVLLGILGGGEPPSSSNPDEISDQKM